MQYMGNEEYWDEKFIQRSDKPLNPESLLVNNINYFKSGSVLDIHVGMVEIPYSFLKIISR